MRSLFSGVSGLKNHQTRMDVIGNNISNVNTTGFKSSRVTFSDMLSQTLSGASSPNGNIGGTNAKQIGLGSAVSTIDMIFGNGSTQSTGKNTDLALSSENSLFILNTGRGTAYTRNGGFDFDAEGNYVLPGSGYYVQGWMANNGVIDTGSRVGNITIPSGKTMAPVASTAATYINNLNAEVPTIVSMMQGGTEITVRGAFATASSGEASDEEGGSGGEDEGGGPIMITLSDGSTIMETSGTYTIGHSLPLVTTLSVYDSLGSVHELPLYFELTNASEDTWAVSLNPGVVTGEPSEEPDTVEIREADGSRTTVSIQPVIIKFNTNGSFSGLSSGNGVTTLTLTNGAGDPGEEGADAGGDDDSGLPPSGTQTVAIDFSGLTQYSSGSTIAATANGNAAGTLTSIAIDKTGTMVGTYTNGQKQVEAQIALQRFTNPAGLTKIGESLYEDSNNSGLSGMPNTASALGAVITPSSLEMSNVDLANEFTDMIITQRGFQSNSKVITVSDEMLETLINLKR